MAIASSIKQGAARYAVAGLIAGGLMLGAAVPAFALDASSVAGTMSNGTGNTASTDVYLQADTDKLIVAAPTQINMIVQADGTLTGPSAAATQLQNGSAFGVHVKNIKATAKNGFALEQTAAANDSVSMTITPRTDKATAVNLASCLDGGLNVSDGNWTLTKKGTEADTIHLFTGGTLSNITKDLSANQQFGTIDWTFAPGNTNDLGPR